MNLEELHLTRIANDYHDMLRLRTSPMIEWVAVKGQPPHVEEYLLTIKVRTYSGRNKTMNECKVRMTLPKNYPQVAPNTVMEGTMVYHPNWYSGTRRWCCGDYRSTESLGNYVVRMIRTLQFDPVVTYPESPANREAATWYRQNKDNPKMFPSDTQPLPNPNVIEGFKRKK